MRSCCPQGFRCSINEQKLVRIQECMTEVGKCSAARRIAIHRSVIGVRSRSQHLGLLAEKTQTKLYLLRAGLAAPSKAIAMSNQSRLILAEMFRQFGHERLRAFEDEVAVEQ